MRVRILSHTSGAASADGPSRILFGWLIGAFLLTLLPHVTQLPGWLTTAIVVAVIVRCLAEWKRWPLPTTTSTGVVAICLMTAIFLQYHTVLGRDAGTPFMAGLLTIKFYELRSARDITLIIFSSFFVVMSALLFSQAIELFIYCLIMMWLLTGILLRTYMGDRPEYHLLPMLRASSLVFLQALPLALLLFFFLPRYSGRFALHLNQAKTGITDYVAPGSIAALADDDSPAMRVTFLGNSIPLPSSMYWRAIVLWNFNGKAWTRGGPGISEMREHPGHLVRTIDEVAQQIVLWPQNQRWIPALDRPTRGAVDSDTAKDWAFPVAGDVLVAPNFQIVDYKRHYSVTSSFVQDETPPKTAQLAAAIALPDKIDPRLRALADQLRASNPSTTGYVRAVLHHFHTQHFRLSTIPGVEAEDPVADFMFHTRTGFCEHYASAFAVLMRLEKIPCRMIVGYRGGEQNPYGGFYMVSQSNAHAWDEVWIDEKGHHSWVRQDPTTVVSVGSRTALDANQGLASSEEDLSFELANRRFTLLSAMMLPAWMRNGLRDVSMRRQEMEAQWDNWVFSYDTETQDRVAHALGLGRMAQPVLFAICLGIAGAGSLIAAYLLTRRRALAPVEYFYQEFCRRMAKRGARRENWEGPLAYTGRLAEKFPEQRRPIETAGQIVAEYRYAPGQKRPTGNLKALLREASTTK